MKTQDLTAMLATGIEPVAQHVVRRRYAPALCAGALAALTIMLTCLGLRPDLAIASGTAMFWVKLLFPLSLGMTAMFVLAHLSRPGVSPRRSVYGVAIPVAAVWALAAVDLFSAPPAQWHGMVFGKTWMLCPLLITGLAAPAFGATLWALSNLAPTRLAWAGAAAGLVAGTVGALVYALHCPETGAAFLGLWYLLGMLIPASIGALIGPRILRW